MVKINIIAVGKIKTKFIKLGMDEFLKRLTRYAKVNIIEVSDEKIPANASDADLEGLKDKEAEKILKQIPSNSFVVALDVNGKSMSSEELANWMEGLMIQGRSEITFVIGGAVGLHQRIVKATDYVLSFSAMTFTHQMIRLMLVEQVYRGFKIMKGEPYHL